MGSDERDVVELSPLVVRRAEQLGEPGRRWLARLPELVAELERRWSVVVGESLPGGSAAYVARVRGHDGRDGVLKVIVPDPDFSGQVPTMVEARGQGYARLLGYDTERMAMLIEPLGPSLEQLRPAPERAMDVLCGTLRRAWQVPRWSGLTVEPEREKAGQLAVLVSDLWTRHGRPCPARVVDRALDFAARRAAAFDPDRCVVVHGDPHPGNVLRVPVLRAGAESGYVLIDPDGFLAEPAYDLGVVLRDWCAELLAGDAYDLARRWCRRLSRSTGVDESAIWQWGLLERVSTGLYLLELGIEEESRSFLETATRLVDADVA